VDGAQCIRDKAFDPRDAGLMKSVHKIENIAQSIRQGTNLHAVILAEAGSEYVVVEGNHRATAFALTDAQHSLAALVGSSPTMHLWAAKDWL
jgi:hypothetical protein